MFISMQKTNFIIHFFLEILHFKKSCNLIGWQHQELEFCQIWDWWWNFNNNISFHFKLFPRKKRTYFGVILGRQKWIFLEKRALSVFRYSNYLSPFQKSEKAIEENTNWRTERQTDASDFIRPSIGKFLGIICLVHTQNCSKPNLPPSP